jgi:hypothetical protein
LTHEVSTARVAEYLDVFDTWRWDALVAKRPGRHKQAAARARDHLIRRGEMLEGMIQD